MSRHVGRIGHERQTELLGGIPYTLDFARCLGPQPVIERGSDQGHPGRMQTMQKRQAIGPAGNPHQHETAVVQSAFLQRDFRHVLIKPHPPLRGGWFIVQ